VASPVPPCGWYSDDVIVTVLVLPPALDPSILVMLLLIAVKMMSSVYSYIKIDKFDTLNPSWIDGACTLLTAMHRGGILVLLHEKHI